MKFGDFPKLIEKLAYGKIVNNIIGCRGTVFDNMSGEILPFGYSCSKEY